MFVEYPLEMRKGVVDAQHEAFLVVREEDSPKLLIPECVGQGCEPCLSERFASYLGIEDLRIMNHMSMGRFLCVDTRKGVVQISDDRNFASSDSVAFKFVRNCPVVRVSIKGNWARRRQFVLRIDSSSEISMVNHVMGASGHGQYSGVSVVGDNWSTYVKSMEVYVGRNRLCVGLADPLQGDTSQERGFDGKMGLELYHLFKVSYDFVEKKVFLDALDR